MRCAYGFRSLGINGVIVSALAGLLGWGCIGSGSAPNNGGNAAGEAASGGDNVGEQPPETGNRTDSFADDANPPAGDADASADTSTGDRVSDGLRTFPLDTLPTSTVTINGNTFRVWLAVTSEQAQEGLMFVPQEEIADDQGMLFVFEEDDYRSFWMKNTVTPLDIAFIRSDGTIVKTHTMPRLTLQSFPSGQPARFALEVKAGTFVRLGIREGDRVDIPPGVFKTSP